MSLLEVFSLLPDISSHPPSHGRVLFQDFLAFLTIRGTTAKQAFSGSILHKYLSQSMSNTDCSGNEFVSCRDQSGTLTLKIIAISSILMAGMIGVAVPLLGKRCRCLQTDSNLFVAAKAFAAGVILATGFVHMLPDGTSALSDPCLPDFPWSKFPFSGFLAMLASLATLVVDFVGTQYYDKKNELINSRVEVDGQIASLPDGASAELADGGGIMNGKVFGEEEGGGMHIVGIHAHAAHHRHSHPHGREACDGLLNGHSHSDEEGGVRHVVVSQVLELGIVSHSVIIGLSLGVSGSACTIRPLIAALSFHQFFEGFALGGCISQAQFRTLSAAIMASFFAITTPAGILVGIAVSSSYNSYSARALVVEGIFDSLSAGILVYMALVDLIAADFLSKRMSCNTRLQLVSYFALFLGAMSMSSLAAWV